MSRAKKMAVWHFVFILINASLVSVNIFFGHQGLALFSLSLACLSIAMMVLCDWVERIGIAR